MVVQHWLAALSGTLCLGFFCLLPGSPGLETSLGYRMSVIFFFFFWNSHDVLRDEHSKRKGKMASSVSSSVKSALAEFLQESLGGAPLPACLNGGSVTVRAKGGVFLP